VVDQLKRFALYPSRALVALLDEYLYPLMIGRKKGVRIVGQVQLRGLPMIDARKGGSIMIEDNVLLNSRSWEYHINMHSSVKLLADRPGAEVRIGENTRINGACVHAWNSIHIGKNCLIAANTQIFDASGHALSFPDVENRINTSGSARPIVVEDNVWIGANCIILPGVCIGNGSIIAAGSVVHEAVPPFVVAGGNPARVLKDYSNLNCDLIPQSLGGNGVS
jgi:acetyltransferase-like isoleucine patch superfamily enzyme